MVKSTASVDRPALAPVSVWLLALIKSLSHQLRITLPTLQGFCDDEMCGKRLLPGTQ